MKDSGRVCVCVCPSTKAARQLHSPVARGILVCGAPAKRQISVWLLYSFGLQRALPWAYLTSTSVICMISSAHFLSKKYLYLVTSLQQSLNNLVTFCIFRHNFRSRTTIFDSNQAERNIDLMQLLDYHAAKDEAMVDPGGLLMTLD